MPNSLASTSTDLATNPPCALTSHFETVVSIESISAPVIGSLEENAKIDRHQRHVGRRLPPSGHQRLPTSVLGPSDAIEAVMKLA